MNGVCKFADGDYGPCQGPMLQLNDNPGDTHYCEHHARFVTAWVKSKKEPGPIWKFLDSLDAAGWEAFRAKMETVSLDDFIPYVPRKTGREREMEYRQAMLGK
jgi:hypothetical protein